MKSRHPSGALAQIAPPRGESRQYPTGPIERAASEIVLMGAMQKFFSYYGVTLCGIPEITLLGTTEDWKSVRDRASALAEYDLEWWTRELLPILDQFIAASEGRVDADFWKSIYKVQGGSGGPYISGWIVDLFPYLTKGHDGTQWRDAPVRNPFLGGATRGIRRGPTTDGFVVGVYAKIELCMSSKHDRRRALRAERAAHLQSELWS